MFVLYFLMWSYLSLNITLQFLSISGYGDVILTFIFTITVKCLDQYVIAAD